MKMLACAAAAMAAFLSCAPAISPAHAETTLCTEITALPFTITAQGVYCLKKNLNVNLDFNAAIIVNAGNVTIDFNGFRINNQASLATNLAVGVFALDRKNITLKNGFIRGFYYGIWLREIGGDTSADHIVEGMKVADSGYAGIWVEGDRSALRGNRVVNTGGEQGNSAYGIAITRADDGLVAGNVVTGLMDADAFGILTQDSNRVRITTNETTRILGSNLAIGMFFQSVGRAVVADNRILNDPASGTSGIGDNNSTNISCLDNEVGGFGAAPLSGCDVSLRNDVLFF